MAFAVASAPASTAAPEVHVRLVPPAGRFDGLLCAVAVLLLILATRPFVEMGLIDDFSYVKTAWDYAQTGHFIYNGWATAMLGWQVLWGALFVHLLGPSFFAARLSVLVLACFSVLLLHAVLRRGGLNRPNAMLGTLLVGFSPIFVPLSVTFMTDVSGWLVILVVLYCCMRAVVAYTDGASLGWLIAGNVAGAAGGTVRQIAWLTVLVMLPSAAFFLRRRRWMLPIEAFLFVCSAVTVQQTLSWFRHQPFSVPEPLVQGTFELRSLRELAGTMLAAGLCLALLLLPVLVIGVRRVPRLGKTRIAVLLLATLPATWLCHFITAHLMERGWMPWTGDIVDRLGLFDFPNAWLIGVSPVSFTTPMRMVASLLIVAVLLSFLAVLMHHTAPRPQEGNTSHLLPAERRKDSQRTLSWSALLWITGPFLTAYVLLLVPRGIWAEILDRYLLPLLGIGALLLLRATQERLFKVPPRESWAALALVAAFSLAGTHDWIASHRARLHAVERLRDAGVKDTEVAAGYEADGLTQILHGRAVIDPRVTYPADMLAHTSSLQGLPGECASLFNSHTPEIRPRFFLAYQQVPCLASTQFADEPYATWMPPRKRSIRVLQLEPQIAGLLGRR